MDASVASEPTGGPSTTPTAKGETKPINLAPAMRWRAGRLHLWCPRLPARGRLYRVSRHHCNERRRNERDCVPPPTCRRQPTDLPGK
jgi:hypothetical protein